VYIFAPFMVIASAYGGSRPIYGGAYTVGEYNRGLFSKMGGHIIDGLKPMKLSLAGSICPLYKPVLFQT
jgi:hypothetical protein